MQTDPSLEERVAKLEADRKRFVDFLDQVRHAQSLTDLNIAAGSWLHLEPEEPELRLVH